MKIVCRYLIVLLFTTIWLFLQGRSCFAELQSQPDTQVSSVEESIRQFIRVWDGDNATRYIATLHDLNNDGILEAIVYLTSSKWCGSGGCSTLVLLRDGSSWRIVTKITITRPPIRVLSNISYGWHNISVWVQGGSIQKGYEAELIFNGKTYPKNPTVPPARQVKEQSTGEVVIPSSKCFSNN